MRSRLRLRRWLAPMCRPLITGLVLVSFLPLALGIPIPCAVVPSGGPSFPCQNRRCGCTSLEQCLGDCCCLSRDQKLAWINDHRELPKLVPPETSTPVGACSCCSSGESCCGEGCHGDPLTCPMCAAKHTCSCCPDAATPVRAAEQPEPPPPETTVLVSAWQVAGCRGQGPALFTVGLALAPRPATTEWCYDWSPTGWIRPADSVPALLGSPPPEPPPRG